MNVFTDGSCLDNGRKNPRAGWAAVFPDRPDLDCSGKVEGLQTNNRAEMTAIIKALEVSEGPIRVFTDSEFVIKIVTGQWKARINLDLVERLGELVKKREVGWTHVRAHTKRDDWASKWNSEADLRAKACARE